LRYLEDDKHVAQIEWIVKERKRASKKIIQNQQRLFIARKSQILRLSLLKPEDFPLHLWDFGGDQWTTSWEEGM
jgi:hypothetical protein